MQLGFVIDHSRCIGCHACTVACKSENQVPLGSFRTWVKYTEAGEFPSVRRSFAVLRCNQCSDPPCVAICPVNALEKRPDGIVDIDSRVCIGCKACMQGCPYDALYLNEDQGTVEKCHFCAHRVEKGLAPACAVVCPTEAIIPGDFQDPQSLVSRLREDHDLTARKAEAETGPNVLYRDVAPAGIDPRSTQTRGSFIWSDRRSNLHADVELARSMESRAEARTVYDVDHKPAWGGKITGYLLTKSLAAGAFLAGCAVLPPHSAAGAMSPHGMLAVPALALAFLALTMVLLVADLKRPDRFYLILIRPNPRSWLVRGTWILTAYGLLLGLWMWLLVRGQPIEGTNGHLLITATWVAGALSAGYTGWLFGQARGRVMWMRRFLWLHLIIQALVAGSAGLLLLLPALGDGQTAVNELTPLLVASLAMHLAATLLEGRLAPKGREAEYRQAMTILHRGPMAGAHWFAGVGAGILAPLLLLTLGDATAIPGAACLALVGLVVEEALLVRAGQALPIS